LDNWSSVLLAHTACPLLEVITCAFLSMWVPDVRQTLAKFGGGICCQANCLWYVPFYVSPWTWVGCSIFLDYLMAIPYDVFSLFSFPVGKLTPQRLLYPCGTSLVVSTVSFLLHRKKSHFQHHFDPPPLWLGRAPPSLRIHYYSDSHRRWLRFGSSGLQCHHESSFSSLGLRPHLSQPYLSWTGSCLHPGFSLHWFHLGPSVG